MARVYGIQKRLAQHNVEETLAKEIIGNGNLVAIIRRMEKMLDPALTYEILDTCACLGGKEYLKKCEKTGKGLAGKTLNEKIDYLNSVSSASEKITLNDDGTLSVVWNFAENGRCKCLCSAAVSKGVIVGSLAAENTGDDEVMPLVYCLCCAGSGRRHLQLQLGVELRTKEVVSTPINSRGEKPCSFVFEIV